MKIVQGAYCCLIVCLRREIDMKFDVTANHSLALSGLCTHDRERVKTLNPWVLVRRSKVLSVVTVAITSL